MFFNWFRHKPRLAYAGAGKSLVRVIFMMILFASLVWAFWANSERYVYKFSADARVADELNAFDAPLRKEIVGIIARFDKKFQVKLNVVTSKTLFTSVSAKDGEMLLGLCPDKRQMVLLMPPLWRTAVGEGLILQLKEGMMEPAFDRGDWPQAVPKVLLLLEQRLETMSR